MLTRVLMCTAAATLVLACEPKVEDVGEPIATGGAPAPAAAESQESQPSAAAGHGSHHHGHAQAPEDVPADQAGSGKTQGGEFFVKFTPSPNPIPHQELFEVTFEIYDAKAPGVLLESASLDQVRALMPAHNHGMKVEPKITRLAPGRFKAEGMRFHMQGAGDDGRWVLEAVVQDKGRIDKTAFELQCCRPK